MLSFEQGKKLVELARKTVENYLEGRKFEIEKVDDEKLKEKRGVFVTIEKFPEKSLRGCVGFPYATLALYEAVQRAAFSSAFEDSRFLPLKKEELDKVIFEVSILTKPELIKVKDPKEYFKKIKIGKDGLILQNGPFSGLLLPQVPKEFNWCVEEFLENLCYKAGLTPDYIYDKNTKIWKFQAQIFAEKEPKGKVIELT
jgi:uncharacterized protein (TIGR00296 family)